MPMATDAGRRAAGAHTTSYTSRSMRPNSSRMARLKSSPPAAWPQPGGPGSWHRGPGRRACPGRSWTRAARSSCSSTIRAATPKQRPACRSSVAATTMLAPSWPSSRSYSAMAATRLVFPAPRGQHPARQPRPRSHPARWRPARPARGAAAAAGGPRGPWARRCTAGRTRRSARRRLSATGTAAGSRQPRPSARSHRLTRSVVGDHEECNRECGLRGVHTQHPSPVSPHLSGQLGALAALAADAQHPVLLGRSGPPSTSGTGWSALNLFGDHPVARHAIAGHHGPCGRSARRRQRHGRAVRMASYFRRSAPRSRSLRSKPIDCPAGRTAKL